MNKRDLLLEIGLEEMPARFIIEAMAAFSGKLENWFQQKRINYGEVTHYSTPRRLALFVKDVAASQLDVEEEAKGPTRKIAIDSEGNWSKAAIGFTKSHGLSVDDIYFKEIKGIEYAHVKKFTKGEESIKLLPELAELITSLHFPNNMRWGEQSLRYVRPIRWLVALYGNEPISFSIAGVQTGKTTRGHRFLGKEILLEKASDYEKALLEQYVITNFEQRKEIIIEQITKLGQSQQWEIPVDESLLNEVTNLVEYPTVFYGTFNEDFLNLPEEVLVTSMKEHQRYFPVKNKQGELLPFFVAVRNGNEHHLETVVRGNEKVLRARLADADFFYKEDQKIAINDALKKLETIVYHEKMGTLSEKVKRIQAITNEFATMLSLENEIKQWANRAAEICKFDLVSNMVNEFPELQGVMGEKYALMHGEHSEVAQAVKDHYKPLQVEDEVPASYVGSLVSIADKLDSIISSFAIGLIPTGSQDPYGLRRQATGIIKILLQNQWDLSLEEMLKKGIFIVKHDSDEELYRQLVTFFKMRLKHVLEERGIRHDLIEAVLGGEFNGVPTMIERALTLQSKKDTPDFKTIIESLSRVLNIAKKADDQQSIDVDPNLFENEYEEKLYKQWKQLLENIDTKLTSEEHFNLLSGLRPTITAYFDHTMVMAEKEEMKNNRLTQMRNLAHLIGAYASLNEIVVK